ncbi:hypothetical protein THMIRHAS_11780 [Thiosulfatimonas sediminis]|uniref:Lipoprotein n=1 Tax=Thiosulfatimonas sediminis TaxID=2675054 RepID=A0A6F8PUK6_9GAMM|nr:DUF4156 domain-containing protein [Thiosulfatimonas sediminis]BBP45805.1 hypothetical protein THMIRHAS_11780 [Thiosulfatimonas sediminis]
MLKGTFIIGHHLGRWMLFLTFLGVSGCSLVQPQDGAEQVRLVTLSEVYSCNKLGRVHTTVVAKLGFIERSQDSVIKDSVVLAKNEAVRLKGNRIIAVTEPIQGKMEFDVYVCSIGQ